MAVDLERDWPLVVAGGAALVGIVALARGGRQVPTQEPVVTGGTSADFLAVVQAQAAIEQSRQQAFASAFSSLIGGMAQIEQTRLQAATAQEVARLQAEVAKAQADAQLRAIQAQTQAQTQLGLFGLIGSVLGLIFSREATARAAVQRQAAQTRALWMPLQTRALPVYGRTA